VQTQLFNGYVCKQRSFEIRFENVIFVILFDTVCKHKHGTCLTK